MAMDSHDFGKLLIRRLPNRGQIMYHKNIWLDASDSSLEWVEMVAYLHRDSEMMFQAFSDGNDAIAMLCQDLETATSLANRNIPSHEFPEMFRTKLVRDMVCKQLVDFRDANKEGFRYRLKPDSTGNTDRITGGLQKIPATNMLFGFSVIIGKVIEYIVRAIGFLTRLLGGLADYVFKGLFGAQRKALKVWNEDGVRKLFALYRTDPKYRKQADVQLRKLIQKSGVPYKRITTQHNQLGLFTQTKTSSSYRNFVEQYFELVFTDLRNALDKETCPLILSRISEMVKMTPGQIWSRIFFEPADNDDSKDSATIIQTAPWFFDTYVKDSGTLLRLIKTDINEFSKQISSFQKFLEDIKTDIADSKYTDEYRKQVVSNLNGVSEFSKLLHNPLRNIIRIIQMAEADFYHQFSLSVQALKISENLTADVETKLLAAPTDLKYTADMAEFMNYFGVAEPGDDFYEI